MALYTPTLGGGGPPPPPPAKPVLPPPRLLGGDLDGELDGDLRLGDLPLGGDLPLPPRDLDLRGDRDLPIALVMLRHFKWSREA
mmetsp:Transcript_60877/g.96607  ORF Transcript_60877/g.96607 Transcript_60877/m.96607 type:complete len:84 (+) Transcript_60877:824-1075(+)